MHNESLGIFETIGFVAAVTGADAALKSAEVKLLGCRYVGSGLVSVLLAGDVSSVKAAVESGCRAAEQVGSVKSHTVIARTADGLDSVVAEARQKGKKSDPGSTPAAAATAKPRRSSAAVPAKKSFQVSPQELSTMSVVKLRELARQLPGIPLERRIIRSARKDELIDVILSDYQKHKEK